MTTGFAIKKFGNWFWLPFKHKWVRPITRECVMRPDRLFDLYVATRQLEIADHAEIVFGTAKLVIVTITEQEPKFTIKEIE